MVDHPFWVGVQPAGWMQGNDLVVLDGHVGILLPFSVRTLHEEGRSDDLPDLNIVLLVVEVGRNEIQVVALHRAFELCPNIIRLLHSSEAEVVLPAEVACRVCPIRLAKYSFRLGT